MDDELVGGVVVGTDGAAQGGAALEYGVREAQRRGTSLTVVHVATDYVPVAPMMPLIPEDLKALGRTILDEALRTVSGLAPDLDVRTVLRSGAAVPELVRVSAEALRARPRARDDPCVAAPVHRRGHRRRGRAGPLPRRHGPDGLGAGSGAS